VLNRRASNGWRVRSLADFPDKYPGTSTEKAGETAGKTFQRGGSSAGFFCLDISRLLFLSRSCEGGGTVAITAVDYRL
jgi:hypothetical protein